MEVEVFVLCDAATESAGKLNILGAFDTIFAPSLPVMHPQCAVAARVRLTASEGEDHSLQVILRNNSGKDIIPPLQSKFKTNFEIPDQPGRLNLVISIGALKLEEYGIHYGQLEVDGKIIAQYPFFVSIPRNGIGTSIKKV